MSGKIFKRAIAILTLAVIPIIGITGTASATTQPGVNAITYIEHHDMGAPYVYGASGHYWAFDCSSLIQTAFGHVGRYLPRTTDWQWNYLRSRGEVSGRHQTLSNHQVQYGDLLFFWHYGKIQHVGIYIGYNKMIDANSSAGYVKKDSAFYNWGFDYITYGWVS